MGNRILKESICTSKEIDALSWFEEAFFYRLIVTVDDYGICPADPVLLTHLLFPRKENITRKTAEEALKHFEDLHLITRYCVDGSAYLRIETWDKHQRLRNTRRKYPAPEEADEQETEALQQREPESAQAETSQDVPEDMEPPVITLPLNDGSEFPVTRKDTDEYAALYPSVDIEQELRFIRGWLLGNTRKRKTKAGIRRFINGWMARAQDRGKPGWSSGQVPPAHANPFLKMVCEGTNK